MASSSQLFKDDEREKARGASDDELRHLTGIGKDEESAMDREAHSGAADDIAKQEGLFNKDGDSPSTDSKAASSDELQSAEGGSSNGDGSLYNNEGDKKSGFRGQIQSARGRVGNLAKNKWLLAGFGASGLGIIVLLVLLFLIAGSLKIPDLAQNITTFEFARLTRQFSDSAEATTDQALAVESTDSGVYASLKDQYQNLRENTWGKLDTYRPAQVMKTLQRENGLQLNTHTTLTGRTVLDSVELDTKTYKIEQTSGFTRFVPGLSQFDQFKKNITFSRDFAPDVIDSMAANDVGTIIRAQTAADLRKQLGISLLAWNIAKYQGKTPTQAATQEEQDAFNTIDEATPDPTDVGELNTTEQDAQSQLESDVNDPTKLAAITADDGDDPAVDTVLDKDVGSSTLGSIENKIIGFLNPAYAVALPACIIYQGSLDKSGPNINAQTAEQQRAYYYVASAADQEKEGSLPGDNGDGLANAVGATNTQVGDITQSNADIRAGGGTVDTSATGLSAEASPLGDYSLFDTTSFGSTTAGHVAQTVANKTCSKLTNIWFAGGLAAVGAVVQAVLAVFTGGTSEGAVGAVDTATDAAVDETASTITSRLVASFTDKFSSTFSKDGVSQIAAKTRSVLGIKNVTKEGTKVAGLVGLTILAKLVVMANAHQNFDGLEQGPDFANEADSGANIQSGELERSQLFGRPLTNSEIGQSDQTDSQYLVAQNASKSFSQRYFATSNANSLVSHLALDFDGSAHASIVASIVHLGSSILRPVGSLATVFGSIDGSAHAAPNPNTQHYGNVQFGWSQDEESLIESSNSYTMLENQQILDKAAPINGQAAETVIAQTYANCFGYDYDASGDGSIDPTDPNGNLQLDITDSGSLGNLLSGGAIERSNDGGVMQNGNSSDICSPQNLGPNNSTYGDLVFRWRLAMRYDTTISQLTNEQSVTDTEQ